jgi:hypothetical protein
MVTSKFPCYAWCTERVTFFRTLRYDSVWKFYRFAKDRGSPYPNVVFNETGEEEARDRDNGLVER